MEGHSGNQPRTTPEQSCGYMYNIIHDLAQPLGKLPFLFLKLQPNEVPAGGLIMTNIRDMGKLLPDIKQAWGKVNSLIKANETLKTKRIID